MHGLETIRDMNAREVKRQKRIADIAEVNYFLREPKARSRAEALAAWERIIGATKEVIL